MSWRRVRSGLSISGTLWLLVHVVQTSDLHHTIVLDNSQDFHVSWSINEPHGQISFEVIAQTLGYIGLGFSHHGSMLQSDFVVGWVDAGIPYVEDRHLMRNVTEDREPILDAIQNWDIVWGYENGTHTTLRFRRVLRTCDSEDMDFTEQNTVHLLYAWSDSDPDPATPARRIHYHGPNRGTRSVYLFKEQQTLPGPSSDEEIVTWDLVNEQVQLNPHSPDANYLDWCRIVRMPSYFKRKKMHMIRFKPLIQVGHEAIVHHIIVHRCLQDKRWSDKLRAFDGQPGFDCSEKQKEFPFCGSVVAAWSVGSEGLAFPSEVGIVLGRPENDRDSYFMMETHYEIDGSLSQTPRRSRSLGSDAAKPPSDSSGIRLYLTSNLRPFDAAVMSIGMGSSWQHIIPPAQADVISQGHCVPDCTGEIFPRSGITVFAVQFETHSLGRRVSLRHVQGSGRKSELLPIFQDDFYDPQFQETRLVAPSVTVLPGDHLTTECHYDSSSRTALTLGGRSVMSEACRSFVYYYPPTNLTSCSSVPSLPTVLKSLGIQELEEGVEPVRILSPVHLRGMTLEQRLLTFNWERDYDVFQALYRRGSINPVCMANGNDLLRPRSHRKEYFPPPLLQNTAIRVASCENSVAKFGSTSSSSSSSHYVWSEGHRGIGSEEANRSSGMPGSARRAAENRYSSRDNALLNTSRSKCSPVPLSVLLLLLSLTLTLR